MRAILIAILFLSSLNPAHAGCDFNVSGWPHLRVTLEQSFGTYQCRYQSKNGDWWKYDCNLSKKKAGVEPINDKGIFEMDSGKYSGEFTAGGYGGEECSYSTALVVQ